MPSANFAASSQPCCNDTDYKGLNLYCHPPASGFQGTVMTKWQELQITSPPVPVVEPFFLRDSGIVTISGYNVYRVRPLTLGIFY